MIISNATKTISALLLASAFLLAATAASAQAAAPAWSVQITHTPSPFERLQEHANYPVQYTISVENTGDEPTSGSYTLIDTPPSQLTVEHITAGTGWDCTSTEEVLAGTPLSCTNEAALEPGASSTAVSVLMTMSPSAPDTVTDEATISGGGTTSAASASDPTPVVTRPTFNLEGFTAPILDAVGNNFSTAGGHPFSAATSFTIPTTAAGGAPVEDLKDAFVELPPGFLGNPAAAPRCPSSGIEGFFLNCPADTIVGIFEYALGSQPESSLIYNVVPQRGYPAEFFFKVASASVPLLPSLRPRTGGYGVTIATTNTDFVGLSRARVTFYGVPSTQNGSGGAEVPLLSNPVDCSGPQPETKIAIDSWEHPGARLPDGSLDLSDASWKTATALSPALTACDSPALASQFRPSITTELAQQGGALQADQPAGLNVGLTFHQSNDPTNPNTTYEPSTPQAPELKNLTVALPAGLSISPSSADGLGACSDQSSDPAADQVHYDNTQPVSCPESSEIGTATATSPLLAAHNPETDAVTGPEPIHGQVYVLKPHPGDLIPGQDGTFRILLQLESAQNGINVKLPGVVTANKSTGQLTATFTENPQLPVSHVEVDLKSGPRAPLSSPATCGTFTTATDMVPWSTPGTPDATPSASFAVTSGPNGSPCASSPGAEPFSPSLTAGNEATAAGANTPFSMSLTRGDGEQELKSIDLAMPKGFSAKLTGIPYCSEAAIAAAASKSGSEEQANPSCPAASQVGTTTVSAGPGSNPYYVTGKAYLAGPYEGGSLSLVFITPAVAGPFDLGNVVVRAAVYIDPQTAQVTVKSDALPQILDGVPLQIRRVDVRIDRGGFIQNPTNCTPMTINSTISGGSAGQAQKSISSFFQAANCSTLKFAPKFSASSTGQASKANGASLTTKISYPYAGAGAVNLTKVKVQLPKQLPSRLTTLQKACIASTFEANPAACPEASVIGHATVNTPLLPVPLTGPAYFVSHGGEAFPSLEVVLQGDDITVDLVGMTQIKGGVTSTTFKTVPDVPFSSFELTLPQGKYSALGANLPAKAKYSFCGQSLTMPTELIAQNGAAIHQSTKIAISGCKAKKPLTRAQKLAAALKACRKKAKGRRAACAKVARREFGRVARSKAAQKG